jgi:hypothetical protein
MFEYLNKRKEKTERDKKNGQSRETGNIGYTGKTKQKTQHNALNMHHYT